MAPKAFVLSDAVLLLAALVIVAVLAYAGFVKMNAFSAKTPASAPLDARKEQSAKENGVKPARARAPARLSAARAKAAAAPKQAPRMQLDAGSEKARAVLGTLSEREAEIVRFLMASGGKAKRSAMQHKLLIPKTSLLRNLRSLERKNIVKLIPFGRNMVAELNRSLFE